MDLTLVKIDIPNVATLELVLDEHNMRVKEGELSSADPEIKVYIPTGNMTMDSVKEYIQNRGDYEQCPVSGTTFLKDMKYIAWESKVFSTVSFWEAGDNSCQKAHFLLETVLIGTSDEDEEVECDVYSP